MTRTNVTRIKVVIYEDNHQISELNVGYFSGQDYTVQITTPDGIDAESVQKAGVYEDVA